MTEEQKIWFDNLVKDRQDSAKTLEKHSMRGVKTSVVEKYSDQAHFIYELLQNADDAIATKSEFVLENDGLFFKHNGTVHFTVTDPENEKTDSENNKLGHINSITSVGSSSKKDQSTIGKFGVGFKAVFQYTETPHIYDLNFQFKIERFIVPVKLGHDIVRLENETVFYFPFDKKETTANKAYSDILGKLKSLNYPILFLSSLQEVKWTANGESGVYSQRIIGKIKDEGSITYKNLELSQQIGIETKKEKLVLFSRQIEGQIHSYSVGFFLEKGKLKPKNLPAFCFFPTKETTYLNFIIHAPFLLTDSREGIKKDDNWNKKSIKELAQLAADSLLILKDLKFIGDNIINILPYKESDFCQKDWYNRVTDKSLFYPFYNKIKDKFLTESLLPAKDGEFSEKGHAYWAAAPNLTELFSNEQLALLVGDKDAKWVFTSLGYQQTQNVDKEKAAYISDITFSRPFPKDILGKINQEFTQKQSFDWLYKLYEYLTNNGSYKEDVKTKPIFKDSKGNAVAAFKYEAKQYLPILFLPNAGEISEFVTIHKDLLSNKISIEFIQAFGIKEPDLQDEIFNHILPKYGKGGIIQDSETHFQKFFKYYKEYPQSKVSEFIDLLKYKEILWYRIKDGDEAIYNGKSSDIYYPSDDLVKYFEPKPDTKFVAFEDYCKIIEESEKELLKEFLLKLGVRVLPKIIEREISDENEKKKLNIVYSTWYVRSSIIEKYIDGCQTLINSINSDKSKLLWKLLSKFNNLTNELKGLYNYQPDHRYNQRTESFESSEIKYLRTRKWLVTKDGQFVAPFKITINDLAEGYDCKSNEAKSLIEFLQFKPTVILTKEQRIFQMFGSEEDAKRAKDLLDKEKAKEERKENRNSSDTNYTTEELGETIENLDSLSKSISKINTNQKENSGTLDKPEINFDEDEEFAKGIEDLKNQLEIKKSRVDLAESINNSIKYSYDWFLAYLKLLNTYGEKQEATKQKSISFQEIKPYKADNKYFLLCGASSYIAPEIENADDFKVSLVFGNGRKENITVEGVSKKGQDLLIYCRESLPNNTLSKLSKIFKVEINFTPVIDLLDRLYKAFINRNYIDQWQDIQESMPSLNYIYGPPGTGKTTTLCNLINEKINIKPKAKFLVLTPTNKAADVVCRKLWDINSDIFAARLSRPTDPELEKEAIYRDTLDEDDIQSINVVASTIHRLPYFDIQNVGILFQYEWDYVIFDESSMTGLHYIAFAIMALFKTNPNTNFIISGDPKQIPPVIEINDKELENFDFQDENIYRMMGLESFNPEDQTIREIDTIQNLNTQYRSIPQIGQLFSELSYSSLLIHDRARNKNEAKPLPEKFKNLISSNVTFIDVPLNEDNSIYKVNKLFYSSYHTYCAILVSEIVKFFDSINSNKNWTIGLISPYKAQAILLNKLITSYGISENIKVHSDTVHGFQGDECDVVFFVCNPNNYFYSGHEKALLSKEYIYNVAISRAKDYLVVLHPYTAIRNNKFINKIGISYKNNFGDIKIINAKDIEKKLFNEENYIENNSYVSGHDNVNVFGLSDMKYFIKANDTAIDIQLRDMNANKIDNSKVDNNFIETEIPNIGGLKIIGHIDLSKFEKYKKK